MSPERPVRVRLHPHSLSARLVGTGHWLVLVGLLLMVTGDAPASTLRVASWPTPVPVLAWPWLYLTMMIGGFAAVAAGGGLASRVPAPVRPLVPAIGLLLGAFAISTLLSQLHARSAVAFLTVLAIVCVCGMLAILLQSESVASRIWPAIAVAVLLLAARVVLWRRDEGLDTVAFQVLNNAWTGKLQLAWVFNLLAPLLLTRALTEPRGRAILCGAAWVGSAIATWVLFSRMGTAVFAMSTLGVFVLSRGHWRRWLVVIAAAAVVGAIPLVRGADMLRQVLSTAFEASENPGVNMRLEAWRDALRLFRDHPIAGAGLGTFDEVAYDLPGATAPPIYHRNGWHAHNVYLHLLAETGLPGLVAWCYLWYVVLRRLLQTWGHAGERARLHAAGAVCAVCALLTLSTTEVLIGARVHASLRMNLLIGLVAVLALAGGAASSTGASADPEHA